MQTKYWCFTINNYGLSTYQAIQGITVPNTYRIRAIVVGEEAGASGTPHLQGYVEFEKKKRRSEVSSIPFLARAHLEETKGSGEQNHTYCTKEGKVVVDIGPFLNPGKRGGRSDLAGAIAAIRAGGISGVVAQYPETFIRYHKGIESYARHIALPNPRRLELVVKLHFGITGTGKTRAGHDAEQPGQLYIWGGDRWFDSYNGQAAALFDDFAGELPLATLLRVLDIYPLNVPIKGGFAEWKPVRVYITSNLLPHQWYPNAENRHIDALKRRIHEIKTFT